MSAARQSRVYRPQTRGEFGLCWKGHDNTTNTDPELILRFLVAGKVLLLLLGPPGMV